MFKTYRYNCPACGGPDPVRISRNRWKCRYCNSQFGTNDRVKRINLPTWEALKPKIVPILSVLGILILVALLILGLAAGCRAIIKEMDREEYNSADVNTIGQYEVPPLVCPNGDPVELEFGISQQKPFLQVWPGIQGKDIWAISPENEKKITDYQGEMFTSYFYLWEHCVNSKNLPEVYLSGFPPPVDGMQVVFK